MTGKRCQEKIRYESLIDALDHLIPLLRARRRDVSNRTYKCNYCRGWHLTSQARDAIRIAYVHASARKILGIRK